MIPGIGVEDVDVLDLVEVVLQRVGAIGIGDAGIEAGPEDGGETRGLEFLLVGPLPLVFELGGVLRLVIGGVEVVDPGLETGVHEGEILVGKSDVEEQGRFDLFEKGDDLGDVVGIELRGLDGDARGSLDVRGDGVALFEGAARQPDFPEGRGVLSAFVGDDVADASGPDDDGFVHGGR